MSLRRLAVRIDDAPVGELREDGDLWAFVYAPTWAASPHGFDLSPALPRSRPLHRDGATQRPVQWYFDNLLPEDALRTALARDAGLPADDAFALLAHFGAESAGSLVLLDPDRAVPAPRGLQPLPPDALGRRIAALPRTPLTHDAPKRMSLAGAQPKLLVVPGDDGTLFEPLPGTASTHILKPDHPDAAYPASVMNEAFVMRLAHAVGLDVPVVQRRYVPQPVYLVERFDRSADPATGGVRRRHVVDTCQLLGKARTFKYAAATLDTLAQAVAHCRAKAAARLKLHRWLVFDLLVGNGDNHLKNLSFRVEASGIDPAPAYDLLSTAVYDTRAFADDDARWPHTALALPLGDAATFAEATRTAVIAAGRALGLAEATAVRELDRLVRAVPAAADRLIAEVEAGLDRDAASSPDPAAARAFMAGERRLLRAVRHIVIADMARQLG